MTDEQLPQIPISGSAVLVTYAQTAGAFLNDETDRAAVILTATGRLNGTEHEVTLSLVFEPAELRRRLPAMLVDTNRKLGKMKRARKADGNGGET